MQLKLYRRDNRKRDARRGRRVGWIAGVLVLLLLGVALLHRLRGPVAIAMRSTRDFIVDNRYFAVRQIEVHGSEKVGGDEIVAIAGLRHGMNVWNVDAVAIEKKIAKHPWVRRVLVRRDFPRRVVIEVEERTPKAIVGAGKLYYIDADGVVFKEVDSGEYIKYPMLTGIYAETLLRGDPAARNRIRDAIRLSGSDGAALAYAVGDSFRCAGPLGGVSDEISDGAAHGLGRLGGEDRRAWIVCWNCGRATRSGWRRWI